MYFKTPKTKQNHPLSSICKPIISTVQPPCIQIVTIKTFLVKHTNPWFSLLFRNFTIEHKRENKKIKIKIQARKRENPVHPKPIWFVQSLSSPWSRILDLTLQVSTVLRSIVLDMASRVVNPAPRVVDLVRTRRVHATEVAVHP